MSTKLRILLSIVGAVAVALSLIFLSPDANILLVPVTIVGLFIVNVDPIVTMVMSATRGNGIGD